MFLGSFGLGRKRNFPKSELWLNAHFYVLCCPLEISFSVWSLRSISTDNVNHSGSPLGSKAQYKCSKYIILTLFKIWLCESTVILPHYPQRIVQHNLECALYDLTCCRKCWHFLKSICLNKKATGLVFLQFTQFCSVRRVFLSVK